MVNSEKLEKLLRPLFMYSRKMELELSCSTCYNLLRMPTLLPCDHIVCRQCITFKDEDQCDCPACFSTFSRKDLRYPDHMEEIVNIFKRMDADILLIMQKLNCRVDLPGKATSKDSSRLGRNNTDQNLQGSKIDASRIKVPSNVTVSPVLGHDHTEVLPHGSHIDISGMKVHLKESVVSGHNTTKEKLQCSKVDKAGWKVPLKECPFSGHKGTGDKSLGSPSGKKVPAKEDLVQGNCSTRGNSQEEVAHNMNAANSHKTVSPSNLRHITNSKRRRLFSELDNNKPKIHPVNDSNHTSSAVECALCHSDKITEFTGSMLCFERPAAEKASRSNVSYFHINCYEGLPQNVSNGGTVIDVDAELLKASKMKCCKCGLNGAVLSCCDKSCSRKYHVPCAMELPNCRFDYKNFKLLCPSHSLHELPSNELQCDSSQTREKINAKCSSLRIDHSISAGRYTPRQKDDELKIVAPGACNNWVLCGSDLSISDTELVNKFASLIGASVTTMWKQRTTHVIVSTDEHGACSRTHKVLKAVLSGQWVVGIEWVKTCMDARHLLPEEDYEITQICLEVSTGSNGPEKGRIRARNKAPRIFSGLSFYFADQFEPLDRGSLEELVAVAGGTVLKEDDLISQGLNARGSPESSYIVYNGELRKQWNEEEREQVARKRSREIGALGLKTGFNIIRDLWLLDTIATCGSAAELKKGVI